MATKYCSVPIIIVLNTDVQRAASFYQHGCFKPTLVKILCSIDYFFIFPVIEILYQGG